MRLSYDENLPTLVLGHVVLCWFIVEMGIEPNPNRTEPNKWRFFPISSLLSDNTTQYAYVLGWDCRGLELWAIVAE